MRIISGWRWKGGWDIEILGYWDIGILGYWDIGDIGDIEKPAKIAKSELTDI